MSEPRQHHILPEFYLAGFTDTGTLPEDEWEQIVDAHRREGMDTATLQCYVALSHTAMMTS